MDKVLDHQVEPASPELIQPSVMYKYADPEIESLDDAEKLMLRIGKENLLILKGVILDVQQHLAVE